MKKIGLLLGIIVTLIFTGCSSLQERMADRIREGSGIYEDEDYLNYLEAVKNGVINEDGSYIEIPNEDNEGQISGPINGPDSGSIHVTFSKNSNLNVSYFLDENKTKKIDSNYCYLNPGDTIYADISVDRNIFSSMYEFADFEIICYESDAKFYSVKEDFAPKGNIIKIPDDFWGNELQIIPLGRYQDRVLKFNDFYYTEEGVKKELNGIWTVDDKEYKDQSATINAIDSYIVSYSYDSNQFFYVTSSPASYYTSNSEGIVIFKQRDASEKTDDEFSVELSKYFTVKFSTDKERKISINDVDGEMTRYMYGNEIKLGEEYHIQYGSIITLTTDQPWKQDELEKSSKLILIGENEKDGRYTYELKYPDRTGGFLFNPKDYEYDHGKIVFKVNGEVVTIPITLMPGQRISYEGQPNDGYMLSNGNGEITIDTPDEAKKLLLDLHFIECPFVTVDLNRPKDERGGTVKYYFNNKEIEGDSISILSGQKIDMVFEAWYGWKLKDGIKSPYEYTATAEEGQIIKLVTNGNTYAPEGVFVEDESHKVEITVKLDKSIKNDLDKWEISIQEEKIAFSKKVFSKNSYTLNSKFGTNEPIEIIPDNHSEIKGKALKITVEFWTGKTKNEKATQIEYLDDFGKRVPPIYIYAGGNDTKKQGYSEVVITVSVVDIQKFEAPKSSPNTDIEVKVNSKLFTGGELIESSTEVALWIKPHPGYYISGSEADEQGYYNKMKYSEYCKIKDKIKDRYPAKKYFNITLDESDAFATYNYTLDGKKVSGTVTAREGQTLTLTYTINSDSDKKLKYPSGNIFKKNYKSKTVTLEITSLHIGKLITRKDFDKMELKGE